MPRLPMHCLPVIGGAVLVVGLTAGCAATNRIETGPTAVPVTYSTAVPPARVAPVDPGKLREGPADPQIGVAYPFDLHTHCGIRFARFGGMWWEASTPRQDPQVRANADGSATYTNYTAGTMTLVGTGVARFTIDDRYVVAEELSITFFPTDETPPPCR